MAKRIYQAKDKLVQRRVRGAMVVENVRTKKQHRIGKKDVELDLNMARGPDGRIDPLDTLEDASINSENPKGRRHDKKRYDRVTGKRETAPVGDTASRKSIRQRFESEKSIRATGETTFSESDGPRRSERFKYRSDDLRDRTFRGTVGQTTGNNVESAKKRTQCRNASRLRFDEEELRLSTEAAYPETYDANDEDDVYVTETGYKPRHLKRSSTEAKTVRSGENEKPIGGDEVDSLEEINDAPDAEASPESGAKQRRRNQASAFRAEKAKEAASAETVEELAEGETARVENLAARKRKTRLNFSDEETGFMHGAGSLAKRTAKTAVTPAMLYANQQLHEASVENTGVQSVEAGGLAVRRATSLAKSSKRAANRRKESKARAESVRQEHAAQVEHRKKEQIRAFQKKKRQRAAIAAKRKQSVVSAGGFVDSADTVFSIPEKAKKAAQSFFSEHKGAIIGVAVAGLLFALIGVSMSSVASLVHGGGTTVISTTYVSTDEDIYAAENAYCALEDGLNAQINDLQNTHPGFDDYEYQIDPIDHNPYQLISYLQVKFGGFTYDDEIRDEINDLFRRQYGIYLSEGSEIRTRVETVIETREVLDEETGLTTIEEYPVNQEVEYEHWTQYAVLTNHDFDSVARANMTYEEIVLYEALNETYGNRPYLFDLSAASGAGGSGIQFDLPPDALSDAKFVNMIREAEKYLGRPYQECTDILFQVHDYIDGTYTIFPEPPWKTQPVTAQNQQLSIFSLFDQPGSEEQETEEAEDEPEEETEEAMPEAMEDEPQEEEIEEESAAAAAPDRLTDAEYAEYSALKAQHPDTLIGFERNGFFEFYGEDARRVAEQLNLNLIERETPAGMMQATGFPVNQWQSNARMLWQHGENIYLSGIAEDGSREEVKHLRAEDYVQENEPEPAAVETQAEIPPIDSPDLSADTLEMGVTFDVDGHRFEIESIDPLYHEVRLKDLTLQQQFGFPIFRAEHYDVVQQWARDAAQAHENTADAPVKMKEIVIDLTPREEPEKTPEPPAERHNFRITDDDLGAGGPKAKFRANMDAIYLLKTLESENRLATPEEQEVLSRFVGWGGIPQAFDPDVREWSGEYAEVKAALTPEEYEAARASTLNAFYTSPTVIRAMYEALESMGFRKGNILEPSCGVGNFMGMLPESMSASRMYGVELDSITGRIARQLYQKNTIAVQGFEETAFPDNFFDVVIGNVPFGAFKVVDKQYDRYNFLIHDYFIARSIDLVRPGGVVAVVTSSGTMDKQSDAMRQYVAARADLLGAVRLPKNTFMRNAGTDVVTDILFFQKRESAAIEQPDWVRIGETPEGYHVNSYFVQHPEMVLGTFSDENTQYGKQEVTVEPIPGADLGEQLREAVKNIRGQVNEVELSDTDLEDVPEALPADPNVRNFSYTVVDGKLYYRENSVMNPVDLPVTTANRVKAMIGLRDTVRELLQGQLEDASDAQIAAMQHMLNAQYDDFSRQYWG